MLSTSSRPLFDQPPSVRIVGGMARISFHASSVPSEVNICTSSAESLVICMLWSLVFVISRMCLPSHGSRAPCCGLREALWFMQCFQGKRGSCPQRRRNSGAADGWSMWLLGRNGDYICLDFIFGGSVIALQVHFLVPLWSDTGIAIVIDADAFGDAVNVPYLPPSQITQLVNDFVNSCGFSILYTRLNAILLATTCLRIGGAPCQLNRWTGEETKSDLGMGVGLRVIPCAQLRWLLNIEYSLDLESTSMHLPSRRWKVISGHVKSN